MLAVQLNPGEKFPGVSWRGRMGLGLSGVCCMRGGYVKSRTCSTAGDSIEVRAEDKESVDQSKSLPSNTSTRPRDGARQVTLVQQHKHYGAARRHPPRL